jgi:hypothetical protein
MDNGHDKSTQISAASQAMPARCGMSAFADLQRVYAEHQIATYPLTEGKT